MNRIGEFAGTSPDIFQGFETHGFRFSFRFNSWIFLEAKQGIEDLPWKPAELVDQSRYGSPTPSGPSTHFFRDLLGTGEPTAQASKMY